MLNLNLQFFAHKKGVGSTKNGRDSESKRLGAKRADGQFVKAGNIRRGIKPRLIACRAEDRSQHCRCRAFAVRTGYMNRLVCFMRIA